MAEANSQAEQTAEPRPIPQSAPVACSQLLTPERQIPADGKPVLPQNTPFWIELVTKLPPTIVAVAGGAWVLTQYWDFQKEQNQVSLQVSKNQLERSRFEHVLAQQQTAIHGLEIGRKSAFQIQTHPRLAIDVSPSPQSKTGYLRYLITWEVSITNLGNREISIAKHETEIFLGSAEDEFSKELSIVELNLPGGKEGPIVWTPSIRREFTAEELDGVALGAMSPGDRRHGEIHATALARPNMWVFARTRLMLNAVKQGGEPEEDKHVEWAFEILPPRAQGSSNRPLQADAPQAARR